MIGLYTSSATCWFGVDVSSIFLSVLPPTSVFEILNALLSNTLIEAFLIA